MIVIFWTVRKENKDAGLPVFIPVRGRRTGGDRELKTLTASTRTCPRNCFWEWVHVYVSMYIYYG
ncbi:hypothetical protein PISMIDRAFT_689361, partial [Pisolithus microcarpus 441]